MAVKNRLAALTANLSLPPEMVEMSTEPRHPSPAEPVEIKFPLAGGSGPVARTVPGQMLAVRGAMLANEEELSLLRQKLKRWEDSAPTTKLDSSVVRDSRWANRHPSTFATAKFAGLKAEIEKSGGNIQPILVRELTTESGHYEIVFGHRRHRACLELGLSVLAMVWKGPLPDASLFAMMDRENRERDDLSAFEQGRMYARALEEGLYPSIRQLAEFLGVSHTWVNKTLVVANLPGPVVDAFSSPLDIQFKHAREISKALESDRKGVLKRAEKVRGRSLAASAVVTQLVNAAPQVTQSPSVRLQLGRQIFGSCSLEKDGSATFKLSPSALADASLEHLATALEAGLQALRALQSQADDV